MDGKGYIYCTAEHSTAEHSTVVTLSRLQQLHGQTSASLVLSTLLTHHKTSRCVLQATQLMLGTLIQVCC